MSKNYHTMREVMKRAEEKAKRLNLKPPIVRMSLNSNWKLDMRLSAFLVTMNKSQDQNYDHVGIILLEDLFAHGQLYVALSRYRNRKNVKGFS